MDFMDGLGSFLRELFQKLDSMNLNFNFGSGATGVAAYVLMALGLFTIARNRGIQKSWTAWVPVANLWLLGCISDQYRYVTLGQEHNSRKRMLTLGIIQLALIPVAAVLLLAWIACFAAIMGAGNLSDGAMGLSVVGMIVLLLVLVVPLIALMVISVILQIRKCRAYWDLFGSCVPRQRKLFSALSIVASCLGIELVAALLIFICRDKEEGMPPRIPQ
jgi:hypothetical protein